MVSGGLEQQCRIRTDATGSSGVDGRVDNKDGSVEGAGDGGRFSGEGARMDELRDGVETSVIEDGVLDRYASIAHGCVRSAFVVDTNGSNNNTYPRIPDRQPTRRRRAE